MVLSFDALYFFRNVINQFHLEDKQKQILGSTADLFIIFAIHYITYNVTQQIYTQVSWIFAYELLHCLYYHYSVDTISGRFQWNKFILVGRCIEFCENFSRCISTPRCHRGSNLSLRGVAGMSAIISTNENMFLF